MKGTIIVKRTGENNELYHWLKKGEAAKDHKYIRREWKNGEWRYYYDDDNVPDKGFSLKSFNRTWNSSTNMSTGKNVNNYYVCKTDDLFGGTKVDKATYDHTKIGTRLYYKNELVTDIGARAVKNATKALSTAIKDIPDTVTNLAKKLKNLWAKATTKDTYPKRVDLDYMIEKGIIRK